MPLLLRNVLRTIDSPGEVVVWRTGGLIQCIVDDSPVILNVAHKVVANFGKRVRTEQYLNTNPK